MLWKVARFVPVMLISFFAVLMLRLTLPYLSFHTDVNFLLTKQGIIHIKIWRYAFYVHITSSLIVLITGVFQFIRPLTYKYTNWHRHVGKLYIILVLFCSGPSGLIMAYYANGGWPAKISFLIQASLWILFTFFAYKYIRQRDIKRHTAFMTRSYALTLAAITLRTYAVISPHISHLYGKEEYIVLAWTSWVPNLIIAEILIRRGFMQNEKLVS